MKKYYKVTWQSGETCKTLGSDIDQIKSKFDNPDQLSIDHVYVRGRGECHFATTIKELPENSVFYRALAALGICGSEPLVKITSGARETTCIDLVTMEVRTFLNNQDVAVLSPEEQNKLKEMYRYEV